MGEERVKRTVRQMIVVGVIASILGIALGLWIDWFPVAGSKQAHKIDTLWDVLIVASVPIFVLVAVVVLFSVKQFRMRPGQEHQDGPPIHGNTTLEVVWTALPAILIVGLVTYAYVVLRDIEKAPANAAQELHVHVTGQQFTWTFQYQGAGGKKFSSAQLFVPVNRSVKFDITSPDVIHDFWVPAWRVKIDAVPGITTHYRVTPTRLGTYPVVCAELCGLGHAFMRQTAHVLPGAKFDAWLSKMAGGAQGGGGGGGAAAVDPKKLFVNGNAAGAAPCGSCHTLADAGTTATVGPDLDKVLAHADAAFVRESIVHPNAQIARGYAANIMPPNFGDTLSPAELNALVDYLVRVTHK